jgi:hypothetical protein
MIGPIAFISRKSRRVVVMTFIPGARLMIFEKLLNPDARSDVNISA